MSTISRNMGLRDMERDIVSPLARSPLTSVPLIFSTLFNFCCICLFVNVFLFED